MFWIHPAKSFCTEYEKSKAIAGKIALEAALKGVPIVPVYPGVIYGPGKVIAGNVLPCLVNCSLPSSVELDSSRWMIVKGKCYLDLIWGSYIAI
ncbi:unnamed protein product [Ilex paraguariensis]|uniref:Uncharacterized protein n=1 Tax=Ilex paraguariensis TaxID=185542 RepID=A0ABC8RS12_9AQUA